MMSRFSGVFLLRLQLSLWVCVAYVLTMRNAYFQSLTLHRGAVADWLISYPGEFVRRGLGGELLWRIEQLSGLPMAWSIFLISLLSYAVVALVSLKLIWRLGRLREWLLIVSPATLFFAAYQFGAVGRKEVLLLIIPAMMLWHQMSARNPVNGELRAPSLPSYLLLMAWLTMLLFLHEGLLFIMPLFALFLWQAWGDSMRSRQYLYGGGVWLLLVFQGIAWVSLQHPPDPQAICDLLAERATLPPGCAEPLMTSVSWLSVGPKALWQMMADGYTPTHAASLVLGLMLGLMPLVLLEGVQRIRVPYLLALAATLPLFVLAIDWGRWLYVIATLSFFLHVQHRLRMPASMLRPAATQPGLWAGLAISVCFVAWISTWQLKQCCLMGAGKGVVFQLPALLD